MTNTTRPSNMDKMINSLSEKMGADPDKLKKALETNDLNEVFSTMKPENAKKMKAMFDNKAAIEKLMKTPQAAELMKRMKGEK